MTHETLKFKLENYHLYVSHGDKGGVGKTIIARLIAEYLHSKNIGWSGIDSDLRNPDFHRHYSDHVNIKPCNSENDLVALLNRLEESGDNQRTIINLPAQAGLILDSETVSALSEINLSSVCFFTINSERDSVLQLKNFVEKNGHSFNKIVVIMNGQFGKKSDFTLYSESKIRNKIINEMNGSEFFLPKFEATSVFQKLSKLSKEDGNGYGLSEAIDMKILSIAERSSLRSWLNKCLTSLESI